MREAMLDNHGEVTLKEIRSFQESRLVFSNDAIIYILRPTVSSILRSTKHQSIKKALERVMGCKLLCPFLYSVFMQLLMAKRVMSLSMERDYSFFTTVLCAVLEM